MPDRGHVVVVVGRPVYLLMQYAVLLGLYL